jgi:hypothetical protein
LVRLAGELRQGYVVAQEPFRLGREKPSPPRAHSEASDHVARKLRRLGEILLRSRRWDPEDQLLRRQTCHPGHQAGEELVAGEQDRVAVSLDARAADAPPARQDRHSVDVGKPARGRSDERVSAFVVRRALSLLRRQHPPALLGTGQNPFDRFL